MVLRRRDAGTWLISLSLRAHRDSGRQELAHHGGSHLNLRISVYHYREHFATRRGLLIYGLHGVVVHHQLQ